MSNSVSFTFNLNVQLDASQVNLPIQIDVSLGTPTIHYSHGQQTSIEDERIWLEKRHEEIKQFKIQRQQQQLQEQRQQRLQQLIRIQKLSNEPKQKINWKRTGF